MVSPCASNPGWRSVIAPMTVQGLHVWPTMPIGEAATVSGPIMAVGHLGRQSGLTMLRLPASLRQRLLESVPMLRCLIMWRSLTFSI